MNAIRFPLLLALCALLNGCEGASSSGPPNLRLGSKECGACGMLVSEDRCSSAMLVRNQGRHEHLFFDDLGCMLDHERDGMPGVTVIERYAHDYDTRAWVDVNAAHFLYADPKSLKTPMGSGIVAFASKEAAEKALATHGGMISDYARLGEARRAWMEARYGKPRPKPGQGDASEDAAQEKP